MTKVVGELTKPIIDLLEEPYLPAKIMLGEKNLEHMQKEHPEDFLKYGDQLEEILRSPDYVSLHPKDKSIQFIKELDDRVMVAVRLSKKGQLFARTLFVMSSEKWESYNRKGYIKPVPSSVPQVPETPAS